MVLYGKVLPLYRGTVVINGRSAAVNARQRKNTIKAGFFDFSGKMQRDKKLVWQY